MRRSGLTLADVLRQQTQADSSCDKAVIMIYLEVTNASIAVSQDDIFIRTWKHLWCIGKVTKNPGK